MARFLLFITAIIWGWTFVATKVCLTFLSPAELLGFRLLIALPILAGLIIAKGIKFNFQHHRGKLLIGSLILTAHFLVQITGMKYTSATNTGWIISLTPLVTIFLAFILLKEKIGKFAIIGVIIATFGILLLISKGSLTNFGWISSVGDWLILVSAHTWALYTILTRDVSRSNNPLAVTFVIFLPSAIIVAGIMILSTDWARLLQMPLNVIIAIIYLGVFGTALGHWFWQVGVAKLGASKSGIFLYLEPLATTALAVPYLHESFGITTAIGGFSVLFGVWISQIGKAKEVGL